MHAHLKPILVDSSLFIGQCINRVTASIMSSTPMTPQTVMGVELASTTVPVRRDILGETWILFPLLVRRPWSLDLERETIV